MELFLIFFIKMCFVIFGICLFSPITIFAQEDQKNDEKDTSRLIRIKDVGKVLEMRDNQLLGYYLLSDLPLTIPDFEISGSENDYIRICINDNEDCCNEIEWDPPQC